MAVLEKVPGSAELFNEPVVGKAECKVEKTIQHRKRQSKVGYLVKWEGYADEENTGEPADKLKNAQQKSGNILAERAQARPHVRNGKNPKTNNSPSSQMGRKHDKTDTWEPEDNIKTALQPLKHT
jgi:hypothetical protein